jgi:hypothetical protein
MILCQNLFFMKIKFHYVFLILCLIIPAISSCKKDNDENEKEAVHVRIINDTDFDVPGNLLSGAITVSISPDESDPNYDGFKGDTDFGTLAVGQSSDYKRVSNRFLIKVNGENFGIGGFGIDVIPSDKWTIKIQGVQETSPGSYWYVWDQQAD